MRRFLSLLVLACLAWNTIGYADKPPGVENSTKRAKSPPKKKVKSSQYKRVHQRALKKTITGDAGAAVQSLQDYTF